MCPFSTNSREIFANFLFIILYSNLVCSQELLSNNKFTLYPKGTACLMFSDHLSRALNLLLQNLVKIMEIDKKLLKMTQKNISEFEQIILYVFLT